ncbi:MAG: IPT/TIG domain-containing protein, partial [Flammeovirgaceae bacterium]
MICISPPSYELREVPVEVTLNNREWTKDGILFFYYHPPFVYAILPKIGPVAGGTEVTVTGSNFIDTGIVLCRFGSIMTKGHYINDNTLKCTSPKVEKPGYVNLAIAIREDEFSSGINTRYLYYDTPEIQ